MIFPLPDPLTGSLHSHPPRVPNSSWEIDMAVALSPEVVPGQLTSQLDLALGNRPLLPLPCPVLCQSAPSPSPQPATPETGLTPSFVPTLSQHGAPAFVTVPLNPEASWSSSLSHPARIKQVSISVEISCSIARSVTTRVHPDLSLLATCVFRVDL